MSEHLFALPSDAIKVTSDDCVCCGRPSPHGLRVGRGVMHLDCYTEHHCGPEWPWPPDHTCAALAVPATQTRKDQP